MDGCRWVGFGKGYLKKGVGSFGEGWDTRMVRGRVVKVGENHSGV